MLSQNKKTAILSSLITALVLICGFLVFFHFYQNTSQDCSLERKLDEIRGLIEAKSIFEFDEETAENTAAYGYLSGLEEDRYALYFSKEEYDAYLSSIAGDGSGVGLLLSYQTAQPLSDGLFIRRVLGNSPAEAAGLKAGDRIVGINGQDIRQKYYADISSSLVLSQGQSIALTVLRDGQEWDVSVTAAAYSEREVDFRVTEDGFGYIRIYRFAQNAADQFREALEALNAQNVKGYLFDVRGNSGGELETVCRMVDMVVPESDIIIMQTKDGEEVRRATDDKLVSVPCVVLIDGETASAAEMFASSLRDVIGAELVGEQSYGKAVGQTMYELSDGSAVKITTFRYFTQSRQDFNGVGLTPDQVVSLTEEQQMRLYCLSDQEDTQLAAAAEILNSKIG